MDVTKIRKLVRTEAETPRGRLRSWWRAKYQPLASTPFDQRTVGGLIREYYEDQMAELQRLRSQLKEDGHSPELEERITELEEQLSDSPVNYQEMDEDELLDDWQRPRLTGDPEMDAWERQLADGAIPDLEGEHGDQD